nr:hypothetical protein [Paracoccus luteus]
MAVKARNNLAKAIEDEGRIKGLIGSMKLAFARLIEPAEDTAYKPSGRVA